MPPSKDKKTDPPVNEAAAAGVGVEGVNVIEQPGDRTAEEKVKALGAIADKAALSPQDAVKTLLELVADGDAKTRAAAASQLTEIFARSFNLDFLAEAPVSQVLSGEAGLRGAVHPLGEHPHLVDDSVIPPGMNNPTGEILPPNIAVGSKEHHEWAKATGAPAPAKVAA